MIRQKKEGGVYYYEFMENGKRYHGRCPGCTSRKAAADYEKKIRDTVIKASAQKNVRALVENFRDVLSGGVKIKLTDAFRLSLQKPRRRKPSEKLLLRKQQIFNDFTAFMGVHYPEVIYLADVQPKHAEAYISLVRTSGRFTKDVIYERNGKKILRQTTASPSNKTANDYQMICAEVFTLLGRDAGITNNPFDMPKLRKEEESREAFTQEELYLIRDHLDDFTRPLFTLAMMTALREGDICTLRWTDIDFVNNIIQRRMNKTRNAVEIPIMPDLREYLLTQPSRNTSEYVFPEHAAMYLKNPTGISYRVKQFLEGIGIETSRKPIGRERAVSVKDLHSCRHTFCYFAGMRGIPLAVVQSIVGHMTPEMTKHYTAHATLEDKRKNMLSMSNLLPITAESGTGTPETLVDIRRKLHNLVDSLPEEKLKSLLAFGEKNMKTPIVL
ncbi:MAG: site-specific integrase [Lentisphaeria bacterium]|nr:site-specific integrase [Lentisphaeria bacterium]